MSTTARGPSARNATIAPGSARPADSDGGSLHICFAASVPNASAFSSLSGQLNISNCCYFQVRHGAAFDPKPLTQRHWHIRGEIFVIHGVVECALGLGERIIVSPLNGRCKLAAKTDAIMGIY
jgi:hypothetical protein